MSQTLKARLNDDIKSAMRARETIRLSTLRFLQAAIKSREIDSQTELNDNDIQSIIEKQVKQRRESIAAFEQAGRTEHAEKEQAELRILQEYLPAQANEQEIQATITAALEDAQTKGIQGPALMGAVMSAVRSKLAGRADMAAVAVQVKQFLNQA